ncbi:MAG TPA: hypothetical protein VFV34_12105, partial [Blastocatellia bacterium]|nr:hypothetical protein [Blastocatellia bacterium]
GTINPAATGTLSNTATVSAATDPNAANNSATDTDTLVGQGDLSITKTDGLTTAVSGNSITYTIVVSYSGLSNVTAATVADTFPAVLTGVTFTSVSTGTVSGNTASGSGNINDTVNMTPGSTITYTVNATINPAATGSLSNTATVTAPGSFTDTNPGNNSATDTDTLTSQGDLAITKTNGTSTSTAGGSTSYTITVSNAGPSTATGATVADTFPASLTVSFTSVAAGGATGNTASGSGNINDTVTLPPGSSVTYTATCSINPAASGSLSNTATVTAPGGFTDTNPGNNSATDTDTLVSQGDLSITKTDGAATEIPGTGITYTITVSNAGPSTATAATVADTFPASLTGVTFTSVASGGATGNTASGSSNINDTVTLPPGSSITYTVSATIDAVATGTLSNTATVTAPGGFTDTIPGNNSATDSDTLTPTADLSLTKIVDNAAPTVGTTVTFEIAVHSDGPSVATNVKVKDLLPPGLAFAGAEPTPGSYDNVTGIWTIGTMAPGANATMNLSATVTTQGAKINIAQVSASDAQDPDSTPNNNNPAEDDQASATVTPPQADLSLTKTVNNATPNAGTNIIFTITVSNAGPSTATGVAVRDLLPAGLTFVSFTATQGSYADSVGFWSVGDIASSASATLQITATAAVGGPKINTAQVAASGVFDPDSTPDNNNPAEDDQASVTVNVQQADLALTKTDSPDPVPAGSNLTYTLTLTNSGPTGAMNVVVSDAVPANTTFVSAAVLTGGGWSISAPPVGGTGTVTFSKSPMAAAEGASFQIIVKVTTTPAPNTVITNTASVTSTTPDPNAANNNPTTTTDVLQYDKCIVDTANPSRGLRFNSTTGDYEYFDLSKNLRLKGKGVVTVIVGGCKMNLDAEPGKTGNSLHTVHALINSCTKAGTVDFTPQGGTLIKITDTDITNNNCTFP